FRLIAVFLFFFSSRRRHTRSKRDWSSDVCSSDLKQNIAYATVHNDEQTPHMHLGVVPMRDGKLQGKNVFNRQELLWLQDKFPEHMKKQGFELKRGERGSDRKHIETAK